jgi:hypothetical protein
LIVPTHAAAIAAELLGELAGAPPLGAATGAVASSPASPFATGAVAALAGPAPLGASVVGGLVWIRLVNRIVVLR